MFKEKKHMTYFISPWLRQSRLAQFYQDFAAKATVLVITTELEIFYQDFAAKALLLVPPTGSAVSN